MHRKLYTKTNKQTNGKSEKKNRQEHLQTKQTKNDYLRLVVVIALFGMSNKTHVLVLWHVIR